MASVNKDTKGWQVLFVDPRGDRRQIRPGKGTNKATAQQISRHVDELVACGASTGTLNRQTALWLASIGDVLHAKLANAGLVEERHTGTLAEFVSWHIKSPTDVKSGHELWAALVEDDKKAAINANIQKECFDKVLFRTKQQSLMLRPFFFLARCLRKK